MASNNILKQVEASVSSGASDHAPCGYTTYGMETIDARYKCIYCTWIMKEPIQLTECGHRCCRGCFEFRAAVAPDGILICPVNECETKFVKDQVKIIFV